MTKKQDMLPASELDAVYSDLVKFLRQYERIAKLAEFVGDLTKLEQLIAERQGRCEEVSNRLSGLAGEHEKLSRRLADLRVQISREQTEHDDKVSRDTARIARDNATLARREKNVERAEQVLAEKSQSVAHEQDVRRQALDKQAEELKELAEALQARKTAFEQKVAAFNAIGGGKE